jgi:uncharacterized protein YeaO (DUF488 family)
MPLTDYQKMILLWRPKLMHYKIYLLYSSKEEKYNNASALKEFLTESVKK